MITLIIEDGTGITNANAYVDVQFVDDIAEINDTEGWTYCPEEDKNKFIVRATRLIDTLYGHRMKGSILSDDQSLLYPRGSFMDSQGRLIESGTMPNALLNATAQAAIGFALNDIKFVEEDFDESNVKRESVTVGPLSESVEYFEKQNKNSSTKQEVLTYISPLLNLPSRQFTVTRG